MCFMMKSLLDQLKNRWIKLRLKQYDMRLRIGISRQQYQHLESRGNPRLDTLELVARGLHSEILLIPQEKLQTVKSILAGETADTSTAEACRAERGKRLSDDLWRGTPGDDE